MIGIGQDQQVNPSSSGCVNCMHLRLRAEQAEARVKELETQLAAFADYITPDEPLRQALATTEARLAELQAENEKLLHIGLGHMEEADILTKRLAEVTAALECERQEFLAIVEKMLPLAPLTEDDVRWVKEKVAKIQTRAAPAKGRP